MHTWDLQDTLGRLLIHPHKPGGSVSATTLPMGTLGLGRRLRQGKGDSNPEPGVPRLPPSHPARRPLSGSWMAQHLRPGRVKSCCAGTGAATLAGTVTRAGGHPSPWPLWGLHLPEEAHGSQATHSRIKQRWGSRPGQQAEHAGSAPHPGQARP